MVLRLPHLFNIAFRKGSTLLRKAVPQRDMTPEDEEYLKKTLDFSFMAAAENIRIMSRFTPRSREAFALKTGSMVLYLPSEAVEIKGQEEDAALRAAPRGFELKHLNGINVGCGDRRINDYLIPVDIMREATEASETGAHHAFLKNAILANPEDLPFRPESLDFIVALHMLEHVSDPMGVLRSWCSLLKPGGGIGLILPHYRYTWNAAGDHSQFGHKWNTDPDIFQALHSKHLADCCVIEEIDTMPHKISFNVVLRKPGEFRPFEISNVTSPHSGAELSQRGLMVSDHLA